MPRNEGPIDRILRGLVGLLLIALPLAGAMPIFANPVFYWGALLIGAILVVTAVTGFCPAYRLLGLKTCRDC